MTTLMPMQDEETRLATHIAQRRRECRVEWEAYDRWLGTLTPLRWFTVGGAAILSAIAGAALLKGQEASASAHLYAAIAALASTGLTGLHTALDCDVFQTKCRAHVLEFKDLERSYAEWDRQPLNKRQRVLRKLDDRFRKLMTMDLYTPKWYRTRAEAAVRKLGV
jgi:hypothetical protein